MAGNFSGPKVGKAALNIWPLLGASDSASPRPDPDRLRTSVQKLAELISPVLAECLLSGAIGQPVQPLLDPALVQLDRLNKRFTYAQHCRWAQAIIATRIDVVFMKGFANAHLLYNCRPFYPVPRGNSHP